MYTYIYTGPYSERAFKDLAFCYRLLVLNIALLLVNNALTSLKARSEYGPLYIYIHIYTYTYDIINHIKIYKDKI